MSGVEDESARPDEAGATEVEAEGETVGEAKWTAVRELERRFPDLDKSAVEFAVLSEGERGLLGIGFSPARVLARLTRLEQAPGDTGSGNEAEPGTATALRELLEQVRSALQLDARVTVHAEGETLTASFEGRDLGLLIGKHGQTIDAVQYLATAAVSRAAGERVGVVVDAAGYRARRRATLEGVADRAADRAAGSGEAEALEAMTAAERKIVHLRLKDRAGVTTASEGAEPNRHVVVRAAD